MNSPEENITITSQMHTNDTVNGLNVLYFSFAFQVTYSLLSIPLHTYVAWLIVTGGRNRLAPEFFTLNLSMCEIMYSCMAVGLPLAPLPFTNFSRSLLFIGRPLFQACICVERYIAVIHPVRFLKYKPLRYRLVISGLFWLIVLSSSLTSAFQPTFDVTLVILLIIGVPSFLVMVFCFLAVLGALKQAPPGERGRLPEQANHIKVKAFKLILIMLLLLLANFTICAVVQIILNSVSSYLGVQLIFTIAYFLIMSTGLGYPLSYLHTADKLRCRFALSNTSH